MKKNLKKTLRNLKRTFSFGEGTFNDEVWSSNMIFHYMIDCKKSPSLYQELQTFSLSRKQF
jgi:hypothetical protein